MNGQTFKAIRLDLGLTQRGVARLFRMGVHGFRNVQRWESGHQDLPGWAALIMEMLDAGELPDLEPYRRKIR